MSDASPPASPGRGPLRYDDEESLSFRAKSFYHTNKKQPVTSVAQQPLSEVEAHSLDAAGKLVTVGRAYPDGSSSPPKHHKSSRVSARKNVNSRKESPLCENVGGTPSQRHSRSTVKMERVSEEYSTRPKRKALSPIKNILQSDLEEEESCGGLSMSSKVGRKRRAASLPAKVQPKLKNMKSLPVTLDLQDKNISHLTPPPCGRKFFKHKSPASASRSIGGIIVRKGFDLKFVRSLKSDFTGSSEKQKTPKRKMKSSSSVKKRKSKSASNAALEFTSSASDSLSQLSHLENGSTSSMKNSSQPSSMSQSTPHSHLSTDDESYLSSESPNTFSSDMLTLKSNGSYTFKSQQTYEKASKQLSPSKQVEEESEDGKFYSIFSRRRRSTRLTTTYCSPHSSKSASPKDASKLQKFQSDDKQLMLDAGQEKFGATQCEVCGMVYTPTDPTDDATHQRFHQHAIASLKFPGWKKEHIVKDYLEDGSRVIVVVPEDQRFKVKKIEEVSRVMGQELGFPDQVFSFHGSYKAFLYISDEKRIDGCCIAESITQGYPVLPPIVDSKDLPESQRPWFCSNNPQPASVGIGRLWVYGPSRKKGIATRLLDCVRQWYEYGILIAREKVAFSDPTPDGREFAHKYTGTPNFLVYKYNHGQ